MNVKSTRHAFGRHFKSLLQEKTKSGPLSRDDGPTPGIPGASERGPYLSVAPQPAPTRPLGHRARPIWSRPPDLPGLRAARPRSSSTFPQTRVAAALPSCPRATPTSRLRLLSPSSEPVRVLQLDPPKFQHGSTPPSDARRTPASGRADWLTSTFLARTTGMS